MPCQPSAHFRSNYHSQLFLFLLQYCHNSNSKHKLQALHKSNTSDKPNNHLAADSHVWINLCMQHVTTEIEMAAIPAC